MQDDIGAAVAATRRHDPALAELYAQCYGELKRIAHNRLYAANLRDQIATESLLHEGFIKLLQVDAARFHDKSHFLAYASTLMRNLIVDEVRARKAERRGGDVQYVTLDTGVANLAADLPDDIEAVDAALTRLEALNPSLAALVEMRFFAGLTEVEVASALGVSDRTVRREWAKARAALVVLLEGNR